MGGRLRYRGERIDLSGGVDAKHRTSRYSLDSRTDNSVWDYIFSLESGYTTAKDLEFSNTLGYNIYRGYAEGYGDSELIWNLSISKSIGSLTFLLKGFDLLNRTRNLTHVVSDNYIEDGYSNLLGRYFLFGVKWHFGKMSAKQSKRANRASMEMMF